jgi:hypothetical protein
MKSKPICDICEGNATYYYGAKKSPHSYVCDNPNCLEDAAEMIGECACEFEDKMKSL